MSLPTLTTVYDRSQIYVSFAERMVLRLYVLHDIIKVWGVWKLCKKVVPVLALRARPAELKCIFILSHNLVLSNLRLHSETGNN